MKTKAEFERAMEDTFCKEIRKDGCIPYKSETRGLKDHPDELVLTPQRTFYWMEFKLPGEDLSDGQRIRFDQLKRKGHSVYKVTNLDMAFFYHEYEMNRNNDFRP